MRFYAYAFAAGALVLGACGGGEKKADSAAAAPDTTAMATTPATPAPAAGAMAMAPITGTTHEVKMIGDAKGYRFEPADIKVKVGDGVKFTFESGGPHNVSFAGDPIPAGAQAQLDANISPRMAELQGNMLTNPGESITVSFANLPKGEYNFNCTPHLAMNMKGKITVE